VTDGAAVLAPGAIVLDAVATVARAGGAGALVGVALNSADACGVGFAFNPVSAC